MLGLLDILPPTGHKKDWKDVYIVSELMDTDLHYIIHSKQPLTDEHFKYFLYQARSTQPQPKPDPSPTQRGP